ncbi:TPA: hypothetical protein ACSTJE_003563 [Serratia fonticola]
MQQKTHRGPEAERRGEAPNVGSQGAETVQAPTTGELRSRGIRKDLAARTVGSSHKQWRISNSPALSIALPNQLFIKLGLLEL